MAPSRTTDRPRNPGGSSAARTRRPSAPSARVRSDASAFIARGKGRRRFAAIERDASPEASPEAGCAGASRKPSRSRISRDMRVPKASYAYQSLTSGPGYAHGASAGSTALSSR